jgi:mRNA-degrading endonuclease RelE of RelBE toxin-antitoxin system
MNVQIDKQFIKKLKKIRQIEVLNKIEEFVLAIESSNSIDNIQNIKQLKGFKNYFRYRLGNYRIGFRKVDSQTIKLITIAKRNDIYKIFPLFLP